MIKAVIFDCFGVLLLDSHTSLMEQFPEHTGQLLEVRRQADAGFLNQKELLDRFAAITNLDQSEVYKILSHEHTLNKRIIGYIEELKKSQYKIGMITNLGRDWLEKLLPQPEIRDLFDEIIISGEIKLVKPQPEIYLHALDLLGVEPNEAVFIDDIQTNCDGAEFVGMKSAVYTSFEKFRLRMSELHINLT